MNKKKLTAILTLVCFMFTLVPVAALAVDSSETTSTPVRPVEIQATYDWFTSATGDTYEIDSIEDLAGLAKLTQGAVQNVSDVATNFAGKTVKLTADVTFADNQYWYYNDGTTVYDYRIMNFAGILDGAKSANETYTITGLKFKNTATGDSYVFGLFHTVSGEVNNLKLNTVTADLALNNCFGSLVVSMNGTARNCHVDGVTVTNSGQMKCTGGLFRGISGGMITNCSAKNVVFNGSSSFYQVGGLTGSCGNSTLNNCITEKITFNGNRMQFVGGLIGIISGEHSNLASCKADYVTFNATSCTGSDGGFGGLAASLYTGTATITDCSVSNVTATVTGTTNKCGGFIGIIKNSTTFTNCNATNVTLTLGDASNDAIKVTGGFIGQIYGGTNTFTNCHVTGLAATVKGTYETSFAGFCTMQNATTTFDTCSAKGSIDATGVTAEDETGGFLGDLGYAGKSVTVLNDCTADVDVKANGPAGGFLAAAWGYSTGSIAGTITVKDCHAYGDVTSLSAAAGGFAGVGNRGSFTDCTASGNVSGVTAGGFWGEMTPNNSGDIEKRVTIDGCEANGLVLGSNVAAGFVGKLTTSGEDDANATSVTIKNSTSAPIVIGTGSGQPVDFASEIVPDGSESHYDASDNNNGASVTVDINAGGSANIDAETGKVVVTNGTITIGNKEVEVTEGSAVVNSDGSIELAAGSGVIVGDKEITVDNGAAIVNPDGSVDVAEDTNLKVDGEDVSMPNGGSIDADGEVVKTQLDSRISAANVTGEYGETITLSATVAQKARVRTTTESTIAFYYNDTLLGYDTADVNGGTVTIEYDTKERVLPCGENTVIIEYGGSEDLKTTSSAIKVTLTKKALTVIANVQSVEQGAAMPELTYAVEGLVRGDSFSNPTITVAAADTTTAGEFAINISGGTLTNADYYDVSYVLGTLTITEKVEETTPDEPEDEYIPTSSSGSFSGVYNYQVAVTQPSNGTITLSENNAVKGETVIVTATPKNGFGTAKVIVTDGDGDTIAVTDLQNGTYSFVMPEGKVSVTAEFKRAVTLKIGDTKMNVFGKTVVNDVAPQIKGDYTMLPIRPVIEALSGDVAWDPATQKITVKLNGNTVVMYVGEEVGYINGTATEMDVPSYIHNSRAFYQLRFVAAATDTNIYWNKATYEVTLIPE